MSKVSITELASKLMEKHGLKRTEAELFIRQFVGVINDGLKNDKSVKVKGLGTFKVQAVSARKSVDVNTGEAIVIEGRDKISFTAEAVMRDLVNAPFAQFETVIVNDGVDFSEIDAKHETDNTEAEESAQAVVEQATTVEPKPIVEPKPTPTIEPETAVEPEPIVEPEPTPAIEPETIVEPEPAPVVEQELAPTVEPEPTPVAEPTPAVEPAPTAEPTPVVDDSDSDADELEAKSKSYKNTIIVLASSLACVVVLAVAGFVYMFSQIEKRDNRIAHLETQTATLADRMMKTHMSPAPAANQPAANDEADNILAANEQKIEAAQKADKENNLKATEAKAEAKPEPKAEPKAATKPAPSAKAPAAKPAPSIPSQSAYDKDPRVRTGAYVITGIANTVTVKAGQTMSSLSKTYLGPGMECYLEAVNGGYRELKAGEKIKIPALKTKKSLKK